MKHRDGGDFLWRIFVTTIMLLLLVFFPQEDRKRHSSSPLGSTGSSTGSGWEPVAKPPQQQQQQHSSSSELTGFKRGDEPSSSPLQVGFVNEYTQFYFEETLYKKLRLKIANNHR